MFKFRSWVCALLGGFFLAVSLPSPVQATTDCTCKVSDLPGDTLRAKAIALGEITRLELLEENAPAMATLELEKVYKGEVHKTEIVALPEKDPECGWNDPALSQPILFYFDDYKGIYSFTACNGTIENPTVADLALVEGLTAEPTTPAPTPEAPAYDEGPSQINAALLGLTAVAFTSLTLYGVWGMYVTSRARPQK